MGEIRLLEDSLINKIAAGEVVERPLSVVKELVENSIDAGSSEISIEIQNGGIDLIRVTDNGCGIPAAEIRTAFERHATSKISVTEDLEKILTLGFRGEALSSIASVAQVEMVTRQANDVTGRKIEIHGGKILSELDIGIKQGTTFIVRNLFYNVPARYKFLKKPAVESGYISDMVNKLALGHPEILFRYINNGKTILQTKGDEDLTTVIAQVYGKDVFGKMIKLHYVSDESRIIISGYTGKPETARGNRSYGCLFVNGRYIKNDHIQAAIEEAYRTRLMTGKFPVYVVNISIDPQKVDVNVHPTKTEARFSDEDGLCECVMMAVENALKDNMLIPEMKLPSVNRSFTDEMNKHSEYKVYQEGYQTEITENLSSYENIKRNNGLYLAESEPISNDYISQSPHNAQSEPEYKYKREPEFKNPIKPEQSYFSQTHPEQPAYTAHSTHSQSETSLIDNFRVIGQFSGTYWLVEREHNLLIIDQHAAHERILFEEISKLVKGMGKQTEIESQSENTKTVKSVGQTLLEPIVVNLSRNEKRILYENMDVFLDLGFDIEDFGETTIAIRALPIIFHEVKGGEKSSNNSIKPDLFLEIIDGLNGGDAYRSRFEAVAMSACKAAVKAGEQLNRDEAKAMIEKLLRLNNPFTCPHGRPTIIELTSRELEKRFKRT